MNKAQRGEVVRALVKHPCFPKVPLDLSLEEPSLGLAGAG